MPIASFGEPNYWLTVIQVDADEFGATPEEIRSRLEEDNIEARRVWKPLHCQPVFAGCRVRNAGVAEKIFESGLCLPSGSALTNADLTRVTDRIKEMCAS